MFYIIHAVFGCIVGSFFNSWIVVALVAFASHFFFDMLPHWDGPYNKRHFDRTGRLSMHKIMPFIEVFDFAAGMILAIYLTHRSIVPARIMAVGILASVAPDVIKLGYFSPLKKKKIYMKYLKFHSRIQNEVGWKKGLSFQLIVLTVLLILFKWV